MLCMDDVWFWDSIMRLLGCMQHWFTGFVTGIGYSGVFELKETDSSAMGLFVTNYCNENPLDDVSDGARALVQALKK
jgi:hypothetical protein